MIGAEQTTDNVNTSSTAKDVDRRGISLLLLLLISLLALLRSSFTISTYFSSSDDSASSPPVIPLVANYSISIDAASSSRQIITSESLPIYLIDTSNINDTNIAMSTWGKIAPNWNRTTQYSNLLSLSTTVPSLPHQFNNSNNTKTKQQQRRQILLIHCGPKVGSTTLRKACVKNLQRTCPQLNLTKYKRESRSRAPAGYFGGDRLVEVIEECVDTSHFCVNQITVRDLLPSTTTSRTVDIEELDLDTTATAATAQNVEYIHLFPFRTYNDWVKSAIKQQYDRAGEQGCRSAEEHWADGKCQHFRMEIDIRKYSRVDLDRFQDGVIKRINTLNEERGIEEHTFVLYLHRDLKRAMGELSARYDMPMLPGTGAKLKGKRVEGNCNESLVEQYHECFSDEMMEFRWDLPENQLRPI